MKTACEEAAKRLDKLGDEGDASVLATRLRAEGRELKRFRSAILAMQKIPYGHQPDWDFIYREAIRIKKARKTRQQPYR